MVYLCHDGGTVSSEVLADNVCTNPVRVRRVMARLKKAGLVQTHEGRTDGGYQCPDGWQITLGQIGNALDVRFADYTWRSGDTERSCFISSGMSEYVDGLCGRLDDRCREYLNTVTLRQVEQTLRQQRAKKTAVPHPSEK